MKAIGEVMERNIKLVGADVLSQHGFTQTPNAILRCGKALSPGGKLAYSTLLSYAWHNDYCFPGQDQMAEDIGTTRQTVNSWIKELERKGFIKITRRGQGKSNLYEVNLKFKVSKNRMD